MLISTYYVLRNEHELHNKIVTLNQKYQIRLDPVYLSERWKKFFSRKQNSIFDDSIKNFIIKRDRGRCSYCDYNRNMEVHHVIPQEMKGSHSEYNLVAACIACNRSIGATIKLPKNWWLLHPESRNK
jgi:hypothetical protein